MVHSNVVVARSILRNDADALFVPVYCLTVLFLCSTIANSNLVDYSYVLWMPFRRLFEGLNFLINTLLVSGDDEFRVHVGRSDLKYFISHGNGLRLLDSFVFVNHGY